MAVDLQAKSHVLKRLLRPSIDWLLVFVPVSVGLERLHVSPPLLFFSAALAIVPIARLIVLFVEQIASRTGDVVGGLLDANFGNAPELIGASVVASFFIAPQSMELSFAPAEIGSLFLGVLLGSLPGAAGGRAPGARARAKAGCERVSPAHRAQDGDGGGGANAPWRHHAVAGGTHAPGFDRGAALAAGPGPPP